MLDNVREQNPTSRSKKVDLKPKKGWTTQGDATGNRVPSHDLNDSVRFDKRSGDCEEDLNDKCENCASTFCEKLCVDRPPIFLLTIGAVEISESTLRASVGFRKHKKENPKSGPREETIREFPK